MIYLVNQENRHLFESQLRQMWRQRYKAFVEDLGWKLATRNGLEIDQFDTDNTVYLIASDNGDAVTGSMRLIPTTEPHLMSDLFSELCDMGVPRGADIWESSRTNIRPDEPESRDMTQTMGEIMCGMMEFGLLYGARQITFTANMAILPSVLKAGWDVEPLGLPRDLDGDLTVACAINVTAAGLRNVQRSRSVQGFVMRYVTDTEKLRAVG